MILFRTIDIIVFPLQQMESLYPCDCFRTR